MYFRIPETSIKLKPMKRFCYIAALLMLTLPVMASAEMYERMVDRPGSVDTYASDNGIYEVAITHGGNAAFNSWRMMKNGRQLWSRMLANETGNATISDNGETITLPLWGWRDEGGSSGIVVYNGNGEPVREIHYSDRDGNTGLRWIEKTAISPDGTRIAIGDGGKDHTTIILYDATNGGTVWEAYAGYPRIAALRIAEKGKYTLAATAQEGNSDMEFLLLDRNGRIVWRQQKTGNFSYEVKQYLGFNKDGKRFSIFNLKTGRFEVHSMP